MPVGVHRRDDDHDAVDRHHRRHRRRALHRRGHGDQQVRRPSCRSRACTRSWRSSTRAARRRPTRSGPSTTASTTSPRSSTRPCRLVISGHSHTVVDTRVGHALVIQASSYTRAFDDVHLLLDESARHDHGHLGLGAAGLAATSRRLRTDPSAPIVHAATRPCRRSCDAAVKATNPVTAAGRSTTRRATSRRSARAARRRRASRRQATSSPTRSATTPASSSRS